MRRAVRRAAAVAVATLSLAACQIDGEADAEPVAFTLGREFELGGAQEAVFSGEDLRLRFSELLEDSRCPTEVECFWTGQARIAVIVARTGRPSTTAYFNTNPAAGENVQTVRAGDYVVELKKLDPYPRTLDDGTDFEDYKATLLVRR